MFWIAAYIAIVLACIILCMKLITNIQRARLPRPKDTVVLYQIGRGPWAPSISPFPIKLETYLRMANIPYVNNQDGIMSSKSKTPWMSYNDDVVADSQFCIEYLNKKLGLDLNKHLSSDQRATARAWRVLLEFHLYWVILMVRWYNNQKETMKFFNIWSDAVCWVYVTIFGKILVDQARKQGMGRHTKEELHQLGNDDLQALSDFLGNKAFIMGAEPCEDDCAIFGMLVEIMTNFQGTAVEKMVKETYPNLAAYCERMKDRFWPDWDDCITKDGPPQTYIQLM